MENPVPGPEMAIKILFFAQLADQAGTASIEIEYTEGVTARNLVDQLHAQVEPEAIAALRHDVVLLAVNKEMADWDRALEDGDEVAFLPPFSGG